jgi:hypothetical protein
MTTNYNALADTSDVIYFNKLSIVFILRETIGTVTQQAINDTADFISSTRKSISLA